MYYMYLLGRQAGEDKISFHEFQQMLKEKRSIWEASVEKEVYDVAFTLAGHVRVVARSQEEARKIAEAMKKGNIDWSGGMTVTSVKKICDELPRK